MAKILQEAINSKNTGYTGLNNSHIVIFDIHSEYKTAFPDKESNNIEVADLILPYWLLNSEELEDLFIESNEEQSHNQVAILKRAITENKQKHFTGDDATKLKIHYDSPVIFDITEVMQVIKDKNEEMIPGAKARTEKQGSLLVKARQLYNKIRK